MTDLRTRAAAAANGIKGEDTSAINDGVDPYQDATPGTAPYDTDGEGNELPDLTHSGIPAELDVPVHVAWSRVMGEVQYVAKKDRREDYGGRYNFRGIDAVLNAVGPALRKHGVAVVQTGIKTEYDTVPTSKDKIMQRTRVTVTYAVIGPRGEALPFPLVSVGEAFDAGDKSATKATSVALRSFYINNLAIPTNEPQLDPEHGPQYEIATPKPPTAEEYRAMIVSEATSVDRLRSIREELTRHPDIANTVIADVDGAEMKLISLVTKVGRERAERERAQ